MVSMRSCFWVAACRAFLLPPAESGVLQLVHGPTAFALGEKWARPALPRRAERRARMLGPEDLPLVERFDAVKSNLG